jgi:hypothetical protein
MAKDHPPPAEVIGMTGQRPRTSTLSRPLLTRAWTSSCRNSPLRRSSRPGALSKRRTPMPRDSGSRPNGRKHMRVTCAPPVSLFAFAGLAADTCWRSARLKQSAGQGCDRRRRRGNNEPIVGVLCRPSIGEREINQRSHG